MKKRSNNKSKGTKQGAEFHDGKKPISHIGAGDSFYVPNFMKVSRKENDELFAQLLQEVEFVQMFTFHDSGTSVTPIPRLVSAQTTKSNGVSAIYRMPGCNECNIRTNEWSPTVRRICEQASTELKQDFNHCVCNLYRDENDSLGYHYDKLLDLQENTHILSISYGAPRPIVFMGRKFKRSKETNTVIMLQPGSLLAIGPKTNRSFQHGIPKQDAPTGPRVSLSLRSIATFIADAPEAPGGFEIIGQGQEYQNTNYPFTKSHGDTERQENKMSDVVRAQVDGLKQQAARQLEEIKAHFPVGAHAGDSDDDDDSIEPNPNFDYAEAGVASDDDEEEEEEEDDEHEDEEQVAV